MGKLWGGALALTGLVACPCHLPLTLPLLVGLLGGTAAGGFIAGNTGLFYGAATGYFLAAVAAGLYLLGSRCKGDKHENPHDEESIQGEQQEMSTCPTSSNWS